MNKVANSLTPYKGVSVYFPLLCEQQNEYKEVCSYVFSDFIYYIRWFYGAHL